MGFFDFLDPVGDFVGDLFGFGGDRAAGNQEDLARAAEQRAFERFKELRKINAEDFEAIATRIEALQNPALAQLSGLSREFQVAPQEAAARRLSSSQALARTTGGTRSGTSLSLARSDVGRRLGSDAGLEAAVLRLEGLRGRTGLTQIGAQLTEADLARQANLLGQQRSIEGSLAGAVLGAQAGIGQAQIGSGGQIFAQGIQSGLPAQISRGIGTRIGGGG